MILAGIAGFISYQDKPDMGAALGMGFITLIASSLILHVAYYAIKIAIIILKFVVGAAIWGAIIIFIANLLGFEWAENIVSKL